jgi:hypothetical protein
MKGTRLLLMAVAGYAGYRLYRIWKLGEEVEIFPSGVKFVGSIKQKSLTIFIKLRIYNPTTTAIRVSTGGKLYLNSDVISTYQTAPYMVKPGDTEIEVPFAVRGFTAASAILSTLISGKYPKLKLVNRNVVGELSLISSIDTLDIDTAKLKPKKQIS